MLPLFHQIVLFGIPGGESRPPFTVDAVLQGQFAEGG